MIKILPAQSGEALAHVITLSGEYIRWMISEIEKHYPDLDIEEFKAEHQYDDIHKKFPGEHVPPDGCLLLAMNGKDVAGCIAIGRLSDTVCELRTLFVRPTARGAGAGKQLVKAALQKAREFNYDCVRLDTLAFMNSAFNLYQSFGFYEIAPYLELSTSLKAHIRFLELKFTKP